MWTGYNSGGTRLNEPSAHADQLEQVFGSAVFDTLTHTLFKAQRRKPDFPNLRNCTPGEILGAVVQVLSTRCSAPQRAKAKAKTRHHERTCGGRLAGLSAIVRRFFKRIECQNPETGALNNAWELIMAKVGSRHCQRRLHKRANAKPDRTAPKG